MGFREINMIELSFQSFLIENQYYYYNKAIILAGSPGSGKSHIVNEIIIPLGFKVLDLDILRTIAANKEQELIAKQTNHYVKYKIPCIFDMTSRNPQSTQELKEKMESNEYEVYMIFINAPLEVAHQRNQKRSRVVSPEFLEDAWNNVQKNIPMYKSMFKGNFLEINNSKNFEELNFEFKKRTLNSWKRDIVSLLNYSS